MEPLRQREHMTIYTALAPFYDGNSQLGFVVLVEQYLREILALHPLFGQRALDLACGTGSLALMLADRGWDVVGVDASAAMLEAAEAKADQLDTDGTATFVEADLRALPVDRRGWRARFDLATCTYDSLNYLLTEAELAQCFAGVASALRPGGLFVADMNTPHFLEHDWEPCIVDERPGFFQVAQSEFDPESGCSTMELTGFVEDENGRYTRFDETHIERGYPPETIAALLDASGLRVEAAYDCFTFEPHYPQSQRIAWVARRV